MQYRCRRDFRSDLRNDICMPNKQDESKLNAHVKTTQVLVHFSLRSCEVGHPLPCSSSMLSRQPEFCI